MLHYKQDLINQGYNFTKFNDTENNRYLKPERLLTI